jgi:Carboxypeptidase regulatory-like domain
MNRLLLTMLLVAAAIPAQERPAVPLPTSGNVSLPLDEYNRLVDLAGIHVKPENTAPAPYLVKSADMNFQVGAESATGTVQMEGEVFTRGFMKVALVSGMTVMDARQKGTELPLEQDRGNLIAMLPGPAEFSVLLDAGLPMNIEAGRASLSFPVPAAGTARLTLVIPGDHTTVNINPGIITSRTSTGGKTTVEATLTPGARVSIWWATREVAVQPAAPREVRFLSDVKTLASVTEADFTLAALVEITVVQGEPARFELDMPAGYELTGATGQSLDSSEVQGGVLALKVINPALRSHQFLISMARPATEAKADVPILSLRGTQRETGEVLVEGEGAMELTAKEAGSLKRMDLREVSPYLRSLAHSTLDAAFRYHRQAADRPALALAWVRFPDSSIQAAVAQEATATTLVTSDGKSLTEVKLVVRNQAQPFLKVALPTGATIVSADVAGERVKPVQGADGNRVPLLRAGFRPSGAYTISFVYMDSGAPFAKKGGSELALPKMDVPIGLLHWEVFLPERYKVTDFGGDAIVSSLMPTSTMQEREYRMTNLMASTGGKNMEDTGAAFTRDDELVPMGKMAPGQLGGTVTDPSGAVVPRAQATVVHFGSGRTWQARTDINGNWVVSGVPAGPVRITIAAPGFKDAVLNGISHNPERPGHYSQRLEVGQVSESVEVTSSAHADGSGFKANGSKSGSAITGPGGGAINIGADGNQKQPVAQPSVNVLEVQRRVAGVLPIAVEVPRMGTSFQFVRPLIVDEETKLTFAYKTR